jgi:two-component system KDP operon response regulator KdpE
MDKYRILVVDDEPQIHRILRPALTACGYEVLEAQNGSDGLKAIATSAPDIVLLDLGLPDIDGNEVLKKARAFSQAPILILSARHHEVDKISALDAGADDYVEKPFVMGELMARLRAALRRGSEGKAHRPQFIRAGKLVIDALKHQVTKAGTAVKLTSKEYDLLLFLARRAGRLLTHNEILAAVWGAGHQDDIQYLRVFIAKLRAKIEDDPTSPRIILTELGVGYRFAEMDA